MDKGKHLHPPLKLQIPRLKMSISPWNGKHTALLPLTDFNVKKINLL